MDGSPILGMWPIGLRFWRAASDEGEELPSAVPCFPPKGPSVPHGPPRDSPHRAHDPDRPARRRHLRARAGGPRGVPRALRRHGGDRRRPRALRTRAARCSRPAWRARARARRRSPSASPPSAAWRSTRSRRSRASRCSSTTRASRCTSSARGPRRALFGAAAAAEPVAAARAREPRRSCAPAARTAPRRSCRPPSAPRCRARPPRRARRGGRAPGEGPDAEPVHDRARRGGDAAAQPRGRARRRRRDHRRRHRLDRPHGRDRRSFGAKVIEREWNGSFADARNVSLRRRDRRLDHVPRRRRGPRRERRERLRELLGRTWREAFYLVETNFTGDIGRRHGRHPQRAARLPQPPRVPLRGPHPRADRAQPALYLAERMRGRRARRALRLPRRRARRQGQVAPQHRAARAPARRSRATRRSCFNLGSEYAALGDATPAPRARFAMRGRATAAFGFVPSLVSRLVPALRLTGDLDGADRAGRRGARAVPRLHRPRLRAGLGRPRRSATTPRPPRCSSAACAWATRPSRYTAMVGSGTYLALVALAERAPRRRRPRRGRAAAHRCLHEHPPLPRPPWAARGGHARARRGPRRGASSGSPPAPATSRPARASCSAPRCTRPATSPPPSRSSARSSPRQPANDVARVALAEALLSQARYAEGRRRWPARTRAVRRARPPRRALRADRGRRRGREPRRRARPAASPPRSRCSAPGARTALAGSPRARRPGPRVAARSARGAAARRRVDAFAGAAGPARARRAARARAAASSRRVYLRRGFLESAADEWIAVCGEAGARARARRPRAGRAGARHARGGAVLRARGAGARAGHAGAARIVGRLAAWRGQAQVRRLRPDRGTEPGRNGGRGPPRRRRSPT